MVYETGVCLVSDMNQLNFFVTLCSWMLTAQGQNPPQTPIPFRSNGPLQIINRDQIYFDEDRPLQNRNVQPDLNNVIHNNNLANPNPGMVYYKGVQQQQFSTTNQPNRFQQTNFNLQPLNYNRNRNANVNVTDRPANREPALEPAYEPARAPSTIHTKPIDMKSLAIINFGLNLLKNTEAQESNMVISPYSIATLLALLQQGALGVTEQQISSALQMTPDTSRYAFKEFTDVIQKRNSRNVLKVANNVYVADAFDLNPEFKSVARQFFNSEVTPIKFARPDFTVKKINDWVSANTNNKIRDLLTPADVDVNSQLLLVNAVYFKGLWQSRFKPESTQDGEFYLYNGIIKKIPFMRIRRIFKTGFDHSNNVQIITLPFENDQYSLMIVMPLELTTSLNSLVASLTAAQLADYHNFAPKEVDLALPKFSVQANTVLNEVLKKMDVTNMFGRQSELSRLGLYRSTSPQVSAALHTAMLSIDEDGGTAAAATAFAVVALSYDDPSVVLKVNRPFLAILWDNQSILPLFMAKMDDPSAEKVV